MSSDQALDFTDLFFNAGKAYLKVTEVNIIVPPKNAHVDGFSPANKKTQMGFSMGSITEISIASSAVTYFIAVE